ncbi:PEP-CTERM sorting domain-containing protein [Tundrisphaera sp. TA3]|uniref:PEP-CTERM sorting domain-containing protein n=1 Tax=Tundrisphaera sp. TA3 TaxID=3435775 RepID=UPI003EBEDF4A
MIGLAGVVAGLSLLAASPAHSAYSYSRQFGTNPNGGGQLEVVPFGVAVDGAGNVFVADRGMGRVSVFDAAGNLVRDIGEGKLSSPIGLAVDGSGNVFVADSVDYRISVFDAAGNLLRSFGDSGIGRLNYPFGVALDGAGNVYVSNYYGSSPVSVFSSSGAFLRTIGTPGGFNAGDGELRQPFGVTVDGAGNVFVLDHIADGRVSVFNAGGSFVRSFFTSSDAMYPRGIAVDAFGRSFVVGATDSGEDQVVVYDALGRLIETFGRGFIDAAGDITLDGAGNVYVTDNANDRVVVFAQSAAVPEPSSLVMMGLGAVVVAGGAARSARARRRI